MDIASMSDIHHESQLSELSVRELKIILQANCVNYKGCVEKKELLEKVVRLWQARQEQKGKKAARSRDLPLASSPGFPRPKSQLWILTPGLPRPKLQVWILTPGLPRPKLQLGF